MESLHHSTIPSCVGDSQVVFDLLHIDPHLSVSMAMFFIQRSSIVYYLVASISLSHGVMDPQCISRFP
jgi:hypothetical protein